VEIQLAIGKQSSKLGTKTHHSWLHRTGAEC